ncbi:MAG: ketopantoate reductase C-terminal domain-containing protein [Pirellulaceae bacterium]
MQPAEDLLKVRWSKLVWNIPYNGLSVVLNADTRQLMHDSASATLVEDLMREVCEAASRCGCSIDEAHVTKMLEDTRRMVPYDSSMRLDFLARRPMEVEAIFGNPLRAALQAGYRPSKIEMLYQQLCFLNQSIG